jgi:glutamate racemase
MIGIFDSGYGGLTVLKPVLKALPDYDYVYLGDNARNPYGNHSDENIKAFCEQAVEYSFSRGVTLIIFACNTASSVALRHIQKKYNKDGKKVLGVLIPAAEEAAKGKKVGVVGTKATIRANNYEVEVKKLNPEAKVYSKACPLLVPFIEENWHDKPEAKSILKKYLRPLKSANLDSLILGCTHYPLMARDFKRYMGKKVRIIESGEITAEKLKDYLERHPEIEKQLTKEGTRTFLTTDNPKTFKEFAEQSLKMKIKMPEKVKITPTQ